MGARYAIPAPRAPPPPQSPVATACAGGAFPVTSPLSPLARPPALTCGTPRVAYQLPSTRAGHAAAFPVNPPPARPPARRPRVMDTPSPPAPPGSGGGRERRGDALRVRFVPAHFSLSHFLIRPAAVEAPALPPRPARPWGSGAPARLGGTRDLRRGPRCDRGVCAGAVGRASSGGGWAEASPPHHHHPACRLYTLVARGSQRWHPG